VRNQIIKMDYDRDMGLLICPLEGQKLDQWVRAVNCQNDQVQSTIQEYLQGFLGGKIYTYTYF